jgi:hypothetical protein
LGIAASDSYLNYLNLTKNPANLLKNGQGGPAHRPRRI